MKEQTFDDFTAQNEQAQQHAEEIRTSRIGGLGGSDAAMILRIAQKGLAALTATDEKRIAVMMGLAEQEQWGGNIHTQAGHLFEEWASEELQRQTNEEGKPTPVREYKMESKLAVNFRTFAHADFYAQESQSVHECKFVQKETDKVLAEYYAQLQWYHLLGAKSVTLVHGVGDAEPFNVHFSVWEEVERDEDCIELLLVGIKILDDAISAGWKPQLVDKVREEDAPLAVRNAFATLKRVKAEEKRLADEKAAAVEILMDYMANFGASSIFDDECKAIYTRESDSRTFDAKKFLKEHPEYDTENYYKTSNRKASITIK